MVTNEVPTLSIEEEYLEEDPEEEEERMEESSEDAVLPSDEPHESGYSCESYPLDHHPFSKYISLAW